MIPLLDRVIVRVESRTSGIHQKFQALKSAGFTVPETEEEKRVPDEGIVASTGSTVTLVKPGDRVLFGKWAAKALDFAPGHWVMVEDDLIGILTEDTDEAEQTVRDRLKEVA